MPTVETTSLFSVETKEKSNIDIYIDLFLQMTSRISGGIVLNGNVLMDRLIPREARTTMDLDLTIFDASLYEEHIIPEFIKFSENLISKGLATSYSIRELRETRNGGLDVDLDNKRIYSIDVNLTNVSIYGYVGYTFNGQNVLGASIDQILCDKCMSILSRRRFKRIKDFYDIYIIYESQLSFKSRNVHDCMLRKLGAEEFDRVFSDFIFIPSDVINLRNIWKSAHLKNPFSGEDLSKIEFSLILSDVYYVLDDIKRHTNEK